MHISPSSVPMANTYPMLDSLVCKRAKFTIVELGVRLSLNANEHTLS